jgi:Ca2+-binding RTX toxin-like protein
MAFFADVVLGYSNSGAGPIDNQPYGFFDPNGNGFVDAGEPPVPSPVTLDVVLGDDPEPSLSALSLPTGSFVTVGFTQGFIINGPGNDIFIRESGAAGDRANVFVSAKANPTSDADFVLLGVAQDDVTTALDLATIGFTDPVRSVKIVGLDNNGVSPGFDVVNVQVLQVLTAQGDRVLTGGAENDQITGGLGNDELIGNEGNDVLVGEGGNDKILGGAGNDRIVGGRGNDYMDGDSGNDRFFCGAGKDTVVLERERFDKDIIREFDANRDKLGLAKGVKFGQLSIEQRGKNTVIEFQNDQMAVLVGIKADQIGRTDFQVTIG